jgi:hypothetical protein
MGLLGHGDLILQGCEKLVVMKVVKISKQTNGRKFK